VNESPKPNLIPDVEPLPDALFGGAETLEELGLDDDMLWRRFLPREISFMEMPLFDQLVRRPYHTIQIEGPFNLPNLVKDHASRLFRSKTTVARKGKTYIDRLLFAFGEGLFGFLDEEGLRLYAPTPQAAAAAAQDFRRYVKPLQEDKPRFFVISLTPEGPVAESVVVERAAPVTTEDLALNYGEGFPQWEAEWLAKVR